jgi:hypothetical protein
LIGDPHPCRQADKLLSLTVAGAKHCLERPKRLRIAKALNRAAVDQPLQIGPESRVFAIQAQKMLSSLAVKHVRGFRLDNSAPHDALCIRQAIRRRRSALFSTG